MLNSCESNSTKLLREATECLDRLEEVVRLHRLKLEREGDKVDAKDCLLKLASDLKSGGFLDQVTRFGKSAQAVSKQMDKVSPSQAGAQLDPLLAVPSTMDDSVDAFDCAAASMYSALVDHLLPVKQYDSLCSLLGVADHERVSVVGEMHHISQEICQGQLTKALEWAHHHQASLSGRKSRLLWELVRARFLSLLQLANPAEALAYAKDQFLDQRFMTDYATEVQELMALFVLPNSALQVGAQSSEAAGKLLPPATVTLLDRPNLLKGVANLFAREYSAINGLPNCSHLQTALQAGAVSLPVFEKAAGLAARRLPVDLDTLDVPVADHHIFHSVFTCPVSKEQARPPQNPPCILPCGHAVARESAEQLASTSHRRRIKCPYCPQECLLTELKNVIF